MPIITPVSKPLDIIIMAGQSNMEGNGLGCPEKAYKPTPDILMMNGKLNTRVEKKAYGNAYLVVDYSKEYTIGVADERTEGNLSRYSLALRFAASKIIVSAKPHSSQVESIATFVGVLLILPQTS